MSELAAGSGSVVAGYRIESRIGAGGMAVVFRARDERLGRMVALKVMAPQWAEDPQYRRRFIGESRAAAAVEDPHVIPIYEADEADGRLFIAMRLVSGPDLDGIIQREGAMPPARALELLSPVASALDSAHEAGLIHRDVKPANILVHKRPGHPDHVYLSDFGLSKNTASSAASLSRTGQYVGTPHYSSPEQIGGHPVDGRADQYALACVACHLLTGRVPFERDDGMAILFAHLSQPPPALSQRRPELPVAADAVLARAMAKSPGDRYPSCREFTDALRDALRLAPGRGRKRAALIAGAGVIIAAAIAIPLALSSPSPPKPPPAEYTAISDPGNINAFSVAFSPDGRTIAVLGQQGNIYLLNAANYRTIATSAAPVGSSVANSIAFSPDGRTVVIGNENGRDIYLWNTATRKITAVVADPRGDGVTSVAFSPDGHTVAAATVDDQVFLWNAATHASAGVLTGPRQAGLNSVAFSPDGRTIAAADGNDDVYLWSAATHALEATLTDAEDDGNLNSVAFSPDGRTIAAGDSSGRTYFWNTATRKSVAIVADPDGANVNSVAFSPDSRTAATGNASGGVFLWNTATHAPGRVLLAPSGKAVNGIAFAPHGRTIVIADGRPGPTLATRSSGGRLPRFW